MLLASCGFTDDEPARTAKAQLEQEPEVVYQFDRVTDLQGEVTMSEIGEMSKALRDAAFLLEDEQYQYTEGVWARDDGNGAVEQYVLEAYPRNSIKPPPVRTERFIDDVPLGPEIHEVMFRVDIEKPTWLPPARIHVTVADRQQREQEELEEYAQFGEAVVTQIQPLLDQIELAEFPVTQVGNSRWFILNASGDFINQTIVTSLLIDVLNYNVVIEPAAGEPLRSMMGAHALNAQEFYSAGYQGQVDGVGMVLGNIDKFPLANEKWLLDSPSGPTRYREHIECSAGASQCYYPNEFWPETLSQQGHPELTNIIPLGDCSQGQCWHTLDYHGVAKEAELVYARAQTPGQTAWALEHLTRRNDIDVLNYPHIWTGTINGISLRCTANPPVSNDEWLEDAYDKGIFVAVAAGNNDYRFTGCTIHPPASNPKTFTTNSLATQGLWWDPPVYDTARIEPVETGSSGGVPVEINGAMVDDAWSSIDVAAPGGVQLTESGPSESGTSNATGFTAGSALLVKQWFEDKGHPWINYPGRLPAVMLGMGDRQPAAHGVSTYWGMENDWGAGRLRLRLLQGAHLPGVQGWAVYSHSFRHGDETKTYRPWGGPLPAAARFLKCTMIEGEDMSDKVDASDVRLTVRVREPVNGTCDESHTVRAWHDDSADVRHLVAVEAPMVGGKCVEVSIRPEHVTARGTKTSTFCYYSEVADYEIYE